MPKLSIAASPESALERGRRSAELASGNVWLALVINQIEVVFEDVTRPIFVPDLEGDLVAGVVIPRSLPPFERLEVVVEALGHVVLGHSASRGSCAAPADCEAFVSGWMGWVCENGAEAAR